MLGDSLRAFPLIAWEVRPKVHWLFISRFGVRVSGGILILGFAQADRPEGMCLGTVWKRTGVAIEGVHYYAIASSLLVVANICRDCGQSSVLVSFAFLGAPVSPPPARSAPSFPSRTAQNPFRRSGMGFIFANGVYGTIRNTVFRVFGRPTHEMARRGNRRL